jgi:tetratricopeptide (TPR) repeat protein
VLLGEARARLADRLAHSGGASPTELLRRYDRASGPLRAALSVDEARNDARVRLGFCRLQRALVFNRGLRRTDAAVAEAARAVEHYERAVAVEPDTPDEFYSAGLASYILAVAGPRKERARRGERASDLFEKALQAARRHAGVPSGSRGAPSSAEASEGGLRSLGEGWPPSAVAGRATWYLADLAERRGDAKGALDLWREALGLLGENSPEAPAIRDRIERLGRSGLSR